MHTCEGCGKQFTTSTDIHSVRFCSKRCYKSFLGKKSADKRRMTGTLGLGLDKARVTRTFESRSDQTPRTCHFCGKICKNNNALRGHERWCSANPNGQKSFLVRWNETGCDRWNKGHTKETDVRIANAAEKVKLGYVEGRLTNPMKGKHLSKEVRALQRQRALERGSGGFVRRQINYNGIKLDSTYEVTLAQDLDRNGIRWERCKRFPYHMNGKLHHYTPDFYLPDYDVYLDPKNDFLIEHVNPVLGFRDIDKIHQVQVENKIRVLILKKTQLSWRYVQSVIQNNDSKHFRK